MVTRRPKRKRGAGLHRQGKHHNRETVEVQSEQCIALPLWVGGNGVGPKASRAAADCHFGRARFRLVRRELFYVQRSAFPPACYDVAVLGRRLP
eukprot:scaffold16305_cov73-Attheya_sp.AAC.1